ncbi:MAG TPA: magnesium chelatase, partial [bacterium]|nr:magnesium chelatase [bacterium]
LTITFLENLISNMERRALAQGEKKVYPRIVDLRTALTAVTGKVELVHEGEQEGAETVARHILGRAVREVFLRHFPEAHPKTSRRRGGEDPDRAPSKEAKVYAPIIQWFTQGNTLELSDDTPFQEHWDALQQVAGLQELVTSHLQVKGQGELAGAMELVLDGLHQCSVLAKEETDGGAGYRDMIGAMFQQMEEID